MPPQICSDPFINTTLIWNSSRPYPSDCFLDSITTFPCALLWMFSIPYLYFIAKTRRQLPIPPNCLNKSRLVLATVIAITAILDLSKSIYEVSIGSSQDAIRFISPAILLATMILCSVIMDCERRFGIITSPINFIYILFLFVASLIDFYSATADAFDAMKFEDVYGFVVLSIRFLSIIVLFILLCFSDYDPPTMGFDMRICDLQRASVLSQITFWWLNKLVYQSYKKDMEQEDVFQLREVDRVTSNHNAMKHKWSEEQAKYERQMMRQSFDFSSNVGLQNGEDRIPIINSSDEPEVIVGPTPRRPHLLRVLVSVFGPTLLFAWSFKLIYDILNFTNPLILRFLIDFTSDKSQPTWHGGVYAATYILLATGASVCFHQCFHFSLVLGMRIRSALTAAIYRKALRLSNEARAASTVGEIVNLMSVDAQRICDCLGFFWFTWSTIFQIVICIILLWNELQVAVLAGVGVLIVLMPINGFVMSKLQTFEEKEMEWKDKRVKLLTEVLNGMKILKMYAWEPSYQERVDELRRTELSYTRKVGYGWAFVIVVWSIAPYMVMLASFATYIYAGAGHVLTAQRAFVSLTLFNMLRFPMMMLPWGISTSINAYVSLKRLNKFFNSDDLESSAKEKRPSTEEGSAIAIENGTFSWTKEGDPILQNINFEIPRGKLIAVVGRVGCGKSSLVSAVLGELHKIHGRVVTRGSIAYVPQQAWIQHMTVQDNILFGREMDRLWYEKVLDCCCLRPDLKLLKSGDQTEIGERGINLSGGQKQRISLARAVYQQSDIYLMDDPLSAVDAHVGKELFEKVIGADGLLAGRTRLLVTHGLHWLPTVDKIAVIDDGKITEFGTYEELTSRSDGAMSRLLSEHVIDEEDNKDEEMKENTEDVAVVSVSFIEPDTVASSVDSDPSVSSDLMVRRLSRQRTIEKARAATVSEEEPSSAGGQLVEEESLETGHVSWSAYSMLIRARGLLLCLITILSYIAFSGIGVGSNIWLTQWTDDKILNNPNTYPNISRQRTDKYLGYYSLFGFGQTVAITVFAFVELISGIRASVLLHQTMLSRILRAPMSFFDTTPIGRLINRFSKDMETIDHEIPGNLNDFVECFMAVLSSVIVISISTPYFLVAIIPLVILYLILQKFYIPVSRQSRRLDSVTRSPIFTHFTESVVGAPVIRAFEQNERFFDICDTRIDNNARFFFVKVASNRWLGFRLELIGCLIVFCAILMAVLGRSTLSAGIVGLSISYALQVTDNLNWMVRQMTELETNAVSVERLQEYSNVDQEAAWEVDTNRPDQNWPSNGRIRFRHYSTRYRPGLDLVLNRVDVNVHAGEKIGIVGRTGAGKSSLTLALFRLIEAAEGSIEIDNLDIGRLGLHQLRRRITILPQDPILFSGSLRDNLDPFNDYQDSQVWQALDLAHLSQWVRRQAEQLGHEVGEGGSNLSVGQRQLVCLARALLRRTKVLVLDEATAAVDVETDRLVMDTVRDQFQGCTILIIAHRLATIMDSDRVMVLDQGQVCEFDAPSNLLKNKEGKFYSLAENAGMVQADADT